MAQWLRILHCHCCGLGLIPSMPQARPEKKKDVLMGVPTAAQRKQSD